MFIERKTMLFIFHVFLIVDLMRLTKNERKKEKKKEKKRKEKKISSL